MNIKSVKYFIVIFALSCLSLKAVNINLEYAAILIPDSLRENANAVVRLDRGVFTVKSLTEATYYAKFAITILNKNADNWAHFSVNYDMYSEISYVKGFVYDEMGKVIRKFKNDDVNDQALTDYSLYDDNRMKYIKYYSGKYPFTIEFEYEIKFKGFLYIRPWNFQSGYNLAVQKSDYKVIVPKDYKFKYKTYNFQDSVTITENDDIREYYWNLENLKAVKYEPYAPRFNYFTPNIQFVADEFNYGGTKGSFKSWKTFGDWQNDLLKNRDELPDETVTEIRNLTASISDTIEKIKAVYHYLQEKSRYVSIQVGIGGYQPFPAKTVDEKGYGDCKALSNFTYALLKQIGIKANYTIIYAGSYPKVLENNFPVFSNFNHVILTVPLTNDTIWLECTNQRLPFAYLHEDIADRKALVITEEGGKIIQLPGLKDEESLQKRTARIDLNNQASCNANIKTIYSGFQYENIYGLNYQEPFVQKKWLYKNIQIPSFEIKSFSFEDIKQRNPVIIENLDLQLNNYASIMGNRLFVPLNLMNKRNSVPEEVENRKTNVVFNRGYLDVDSIIYNIPENYAIENIPDPVSISTMFGNYNSNVIVRENELIYVRKILIKKGIYKPESYDILRDFYKQIEKADRCKAVLIKNS